MGVKNVNRRIATPVDACIVCGSMRVRVRVGGMIYLWCVDRCVEECCFTRIFVSIPCGVCVLCVVNNHEHMSAHVSMN